MMAKFSKGLMVALVLPGAALALLGTRGPHTNLPLAASRRPAVWGGREAAPRARVAGPFPRRSGGLFAEEPAGGSGGAAAARAEEEEDRRPTPSIGDIVTSASKWKGEILVGRISLLQFIGSRNEWIADVVVFTEQPSEKGLYREERRRRISQTAPVATLKPVRASYVRSLDGYKVPVDKATGRVLNYVDSYRIDSDFVLPTPEVSPLPFLVFTLFFFTTKRFRAQ